MKNLNHITPLDAAEAVLREFVENVEAVGPKKVGHDWPDLSITYQCALLALARIEAGKNEKQPEPKHYTMIDAKAERLRREIDWFREHGATLQKYVERYGSHMDERHFGDGGELIFAADLGALKQKLIDLGEDLYRGGWRGVEIAAIYAEAKMLVDLAEKSALPEKAGGAE